MCSSDLNIWKECDRYKKRMAEEHIDGVPGLQNYFTNSIERFLAAHRKTLIGWDEILDGDVSPRAVVMSWREEVDGGGEALRRGHRVIQSPTSHCYLDYFQDNPYFEPQGLLGYTPLKQTPDGELIGVKGVQPRGQSVIDSVDGVDSLLEGIHPHDAQDRGEVLGEVEFAARHDTDTDTEQIGRAHV